MRDCTPLPAGPVERRRLVGALLCVLVFLGGGGAVADNASGLPEADDFGVPALAAEDAAAPRARGAPPYDPEELTPQERYRMALLLIMFGLGGLFFMLLVISLFRLARFQRRRMQLGRKTPPTEYIDAWQRHRLPPDEPDGDDSPDGDAEDKPPS